MSDFRVGRAWLRAYRTRGPGLRVRAANGMMSFWLGRRMIELAWLCPVGHECKRCFDPYRMPPEPAPDADAR